MLGTCSRQEGPRSKTTIPYREVVTFTEYRRPEKGKKPYTAEIDETAIPYVKIEISEIPQEKKKYNTAIPLAPMFPFSLSH